MSVENVSAVVNIKTLKGRLIAHKFSNGWAVGVVRSVEKKSVAGQFAVKYNIIIISQKHKAKHGRLRVDKVLGYFLLLYKSKHWWTGEKLVQCFHILCHDALRSFSFCLCRFRFSIHSLHTNKASATRGYLEHRVTTGR